MVFALETYCPASDGFSAARIEEEVVVTPGGPRILTLFPAQDLFIANPYPGQGYGAQPGHEVLALPTGFPLAALIRAGPKPAIRSDHCFSHDHDRSCRDAPRQNGRDHEGRGSLGIWAGAETGIWLGTERGRRDHWG